MVLWWIANAIALLIVIPAVLLLARQVLALAHEVLRYARDIAERSGGLADNLEPLPALETTRQEVAGLRAEAVAYVGALGRGR